MNHCVRRSGSPLHPCVLLAVLMIPGTTIAQDDPSTDLPKRIAEFWSAKTTHDRRLVAKTIESSGATFDEVYRRLRRGRTYSADVPRGILRREHEIDGIRHPYLILVPANYSPKRKLPVRFDLHGGMGAKEWKKLDGAWNPGWKPVDDQIVILPAGWWDSMWWEHSQVKNFEAILREVRETWNVDEDRCVLCGSSDGGAAVFFQAMRTPDRWAGYGGFVAPPDRLVRKEFRPDGQMHVSNLFGQRFHLGYGEKDRLVPLRFIEQYMALFEKAGAQIDWYWIKGQGHSLRLTKARLRDWGKFLWNTVRDPLPDELSWATENPARYGRRSWLRIDELGESKVIDRSEILPRLGTSIQLRGPTATRKPWGRVRLRRLGNVVTAKVENVARFTLLISPGEFDLSRPIRVVVNGRTVVDQRCTSSVATLLEWAAKDDDTRRLFAGRRGGVGDGRTIPIR